MFLQKGIGCAVRFCIVIISFYREGRRISLISGFAFLFLMLPTFCIEVQYSCRERGRWLSNWIQKPLWPNLPTLLHPVEGISKSEEPIKNTSFASQISEPPFALLEFLKLCWRKILYFNFVFTILNFCHFVKQITCFETLLC